MSPVTSLSLPRSWGDLVELLLEPHGRGKILCDDAVANHIVGRIESADEDDADLGGTVVREARGAEPVDGDLERRRRPPLAFQENAAPQRVLAHDARADGGINVCGASDSAVVFGEEHGPV